MLQSVFILWRCRLQSLLLHFILKEFYCMLNAIVHLKALVSHCCAYNCTKKNCVWRPIKMVIITLNDICSDSYKRKILWIKASNNVMHVLLAYGAIKLWRLWPLVKVFCFCVMLKRDNMLFRRHTHSRTVRFSFIWIQYDNDYQFSPAQSL